MTAFRSTRRLLAPATAATLAVLLPLPSLAATFVVTSNADSGAGTLRAAIVLANANPDLDEITFAIGSGPVVIKPLTYLPTISQPLRIRGLTQLPTGSAPRVILDGSGGGTANVGLYLNAPGCIGAQCYVEGLTIINFPGDGIRVQAGIWSVRGNWIGLTQQGAAGNGGGVRVFSTQCTIGGSGIGEGNVISGNGNYGVMLDGDYNQVNGNWIGLSTEGTSAVPNEVDGVKVTGKGNWIGGFSLGSGNVISGNAYSGVSISPTGIETLVLANRIGTSADGMTAVGNARYGVDVDANSVYVGLSTVGNVISANGYGGVGIGSGAIGVTVAANWIGLNADGTGVLGNPSSGVRVYEATDAIIGGASAGDGNVISGNINGISIDGGSTGTVVQGNRIGTNPAGTAAMGNSGDGVRIDGPDTLVGGSLSGEANQIAGNSGNGVSLNSVDAINVVISGNRIGTNPGGTAAIGNGGYGIRALKAGNLRIGGSAAGEGNLVSGNGRGISLEGGVNGATVQGNRIGTDVTGNSAIPNLAYTVDVGGKDVLIGGGQPGQGNLISGNSDDGIDVSGDNAINTVIAGNRIGTRAAGMNALPNGSYGIRALSGAGLLIGGDTLAEGNLVSGNERGIAIEEGVSGAVLKNNVVGLTVDLTAKLPNGNWNGIDVSAPDTLVGTPGAGNVVAGGNYSGITIGGESAAGIKIQSNWIGTNRVGASGLGNRIGGIFVRRGLAVQIGGLGPDEGNVIANNDYAGIFLDTGHSVSFLGNRMYGNAPIGIELRGLGPEANDAGDPDTGPNHYQNFPVITHALWGGGMVGVEGFLQSMPSSDFIVELFHSPTCHSSGLGEGKTPIGHFTVSTDASGYGSFSQTVPSANSGVVTALATAMDGSTSAFSPCHALTGSNPGVLQVWRSPLLSWEGAPPLEVTVVRSMGNAGPVSVTLTTSDDSATSPADYLGTTQQIDFADGEVMKTVLIPVVADNMSEGQEQFHVSLDNPTGGATLGPQASVDAIIIDVDATFPMYYVDAPSIDEPASGQADMVFTVTLTPNDSQRTISYHTEDGSAVAGLDYVAVSGQLVFPPSDVVQTQTVSVPVLADGTAEDAETFYLDTTSSGQIAVFDSPGIGTIHASSASSEIFSDGLED